MEAAISNIGGMDAGRVRVRVSADGRRLKTVTLDRAPAGDSLLGNRVVVSAPWRPRPGNHVLEARIESAPGCTVVDARGEVEYFVGR